MTDRPFIVTHHAPDLDAITSVWLLKKFDSQHYADAIIGFVNPGDRITDAASQELGANAEQATHVDTGLGEFDHHQPERAQQKISASSLVYDHVCDVHPDLKQDGALQEIVAFVTDIDHFGEIYWPEAGHSRYSMMIHELLRGFEFQDPHDDDSQLHFGFTCLDAAYAAITQRQKAEEIIDEKGTEFKTKYGKGIGFLTRNDDTLKVAQKQGYAITVRKDSAHGHIRIKARPDSGVDFKNLHEKILQEDTKGTWFYHGSGMMLINGSRKHRDQVASPLSLDKVIELITELYKA